MIQSLHKYPTFVQQMCVIRHDCNEVMAAMTAAELIQGS